MSRYSTVHTGSNTQLGGLKEGLLMVRYQSLKLDAVTKPEVPPMSIGKLIQSMSCIIFLKFIGISDSDYGIENNN